MWLVSGPGLNHAPAVVHVPNALADTSALEGERAGEGWISRRVASNGVISVAWQEISCGKHRAGRLVDIHLQGPTMQIFDGDELLRTVLRTTDKEVKKRRAAKAS